MKSNTEKKFGYILLCIGIISIIFALYSVYKVFTDKAQPPEIFQMKGVNLVISPHNRDMSPSDVTIALNSEIRKIVNIFLYYLFMLFILAVGTKVTALGIQLIREINVDIKR